MNTPIAIDEMTDRELDMLYEDYIENQHEERRRKVTDQVVGLCDVCHANGVVSIKFNVEREDAGVVEYTFCATHLQHVLNLDVEAVESRMEYCEEMESLEERAYAGYY